MTTKGRPVAIALAVVFAFAVLVQGERAPGERRLIIHADDLGMSHAVNRATFEALEHGWITSASILVPCPWFPEVAALGDEHPDADLGIHLAVNSEWTGFRWGPLSGRRRRPVAARRGRLPAAARGRVRRQPREAGEIERELRAQIDRAQAAGVKLTHLDSHMATLFRTPEFFEVYRKLADSYQLPVLIERLGERGGEQSPWATSAAQDRAGRSRRLDRHRASPQADWPAGLREDAGAAAAGVYQLIVHLAYDDEEMRGATFDHPNWGAAWRQNDFDLVKSEAFREFLKAQQFVLAGWKDPGEGSSDATKSAHCCRIATT